MAGANRVCRARGRSIPASRSNRRYSASVNAGAGSASTVEGVCAAVGAVTSVRRDRYKGQMKDRESTERILRSRTERPIEKPSRWATTRRAAPAPRGRRFLGGTRCGDSARFPARFSLDPLQGHTARAFLTRTIRSPTVPVQYLERKDDNSRYDDSGQIPRNPRADPAIPAVSSACPPRRLCRRGSPGRSRRQSSSPAPGFEESHPAPVHEEHKQNGGAPEARGHQTGRRAPEHRTGRPAHPHGGRKAGTCHRPAAKDRTPRSGQGRARTEE